MGRHNKQPEGHGALLEQTPTHGVPMPAPPGTGASATGRRGWVKVLVSVPLLPVLALIIAISVVGYAFATSQISLNFAGGPPQAQQAPQADAQDAAGQPLYQRGKERASRDTVRETDAVVAFRMVKRTPGGFTGTATITNRGERPINGWTLGFKIPNVRVLSATNATVVGMGKVAWVRNPASAPFINPGASVRVVFTAQGPVARPSKCKFNSLECILA